jgi:hypothetical protein
MKVTPNTLLCVLTAGVLSVATCYAIGVLAPTGLGDALSMPGALVGTLGGAAGLYDIPSGTWSRVVIVGNFVTYGVIWWCLVRVVLRRWGYGNAR